MTIRPLGPDDLERVCEIYNHAVRHTTATLDTEEKSIAEMSAWLAAHHGRYPALGVELDGALQAYGSLSPFAARKGYLASAEISVYVAPERWGQGLGTMLCATLTERADSGGLSTVLSFVTSTNTASLRLLRSLGYVHNGVLRHVGYKLGRLVDLEVYQRVFAENLVRFDGRPLPVIFGEEREA